MPQSPKHNLLNPSSPPLPPPPLSPEYIYYLLLTMEKKEISFGPFTSSPSGQAKATEQLREAVKAKNNPYALSKLDEKIESAGHPFLIDCLFGEVEEVPVADVRTSCSNVEEYLAKRCIYTTIYEKNPVVATLINQLDEGTTQTIYLVRSTSTNETKDDLEFGRPCSFIDLNKAKDYLINVLSGVQGSGSFILKYGDMVPGWCLIIPASIRELRTGHITMFQATLEERKRVPFSETDTTS
ncbi:predicted protein [Plenodomus lingam JN3]|uniref:Predicted protein n=2 Tax=Leptosphaeria maculans TaxID=5022 RepID=E5ABE2_LEPMJ|nr:predicted protein [Plenodomus lingam JN3]CBY00983.1 predicted protein [Plenodomus lingam JN3]